MSLSAAVAELEADNERLRAENNVLRRQLDLLDGDAVDVDLMLRHKISRGQAAVLSTLIAAKGKAVSRYALEDIVPKRDRAKDRSASVMAVHISRLRERLGFDAIETVHGYGWRVDPAHRSLAA